MADTAVERLPLLWLGRLYGQVAVAVRDAGLLVRSNLAQTCPTGFGPTCLWPWGKMLSGMRIRPENLYAIC